MTRQGHIEELGRRASLDSDSSSETLDKSPLHTSIPLFVAHTVCCFQVGVLVFQGVLLSPARTTKKHGIDGEGEKEVYFILRNWLT